MYTKSRMKSKRKVSFISWNSTSFLMAKLEELRLQGDIHFYIFIFHLHEPDEGEDHHHVILFPAKGLEYEDIKSHFTEPQPNGLLPLGISYIPFYEEKGGEYHWILYNMHDPEYIKSKYKQVKKYTYSVEQMISPDERTLQQLVHEAYATTDFRKDKIINELLEEGVSPASLIKNGYIPIKDACSYHHYFQMTKEG